MKAPVTPNAGKNAVSADDLKIIVRGDNVWRGTLAQFIQDNKDGLTCMDVIAISDAIARGEMYEGGGGAEGEWNIFPSDVDDTYSLCEAVADLSASFALAERVPNNSREMCRLCIEWAKEFEAKHEHTVWGETEGPEYIEAIDAFFADKYAAWVATDRDHRPSDAKRISKPAVKTLVSAFVALESTLRHVAEGTHTRAMVMDAGRITVSAIADLKSGRVA